MTAKLDPLMEALASSDVLDPAGAAVTAIGRGIPRDLARRAHELLGHPIHPMFTDLPIGFWTSAWFLDLLPGRVHRGSFLGAPAVGFTRIGRCWQDGVFLGCCLL